MLNTLCSHSVTEQRRQYPPAGVVCYGTVGWCAGGRPSGPHYGYLTVHRAYHRKRPSLIGGGRAITEPRQTYRAVKPSRVPTRRAYIHRNQPSVVRSRASEEGLVIFAQPASFIPVSGSRIHAEQPHHAPKRPPTHTQTDRHTGRGDKGHATGR